MEAITAFPAGIEGAFSRWQVGLPTTIFDDHPVQVLQGNNPWQLPVNFYFDQTGLLMRIVRWNRTMIGTVPTQIDLQRLSRRRRGEDALPDRRDVDQRTEHRHAHRRAAECRHRRGEVRQARAVS